MKHIVITFLFCFSLISALTLNAEDWFTWRGPNRNGISNETGLNFKSIQNNIRINWKKELGTGCSSIAVKGNYIYTMGYKGKKNVIYCLDVKTGREIWNYSYKCSVGHYT